ncbi:MAG: NADP-dependent malic enzyme [bacterium]|nr:NADP-dependent malic enzyme [bacterium]
MSDPFQESLAMHREHHGKLAVRSKVPLETREDLSRAYSPGVAEPCRAIAADKALARELTVKGNSIAVVTDGTAVLGLGDIGPEAALPVMEGKALLFKRFADIDAWPICLGTTDTDEIVETVRRLAPGFGGINLEDIAAPRCFEIEERLQDLGIPVFHDDQHGTAIVLLAGLINAAKVTGRTLGEMSVVINGAGAAGTAIAKFLRCVGFDPRECWPVGEVVMCDSRGAIHAGREDLNPAKRELLGYTNRGGKSGSLQEVLSGAQVFIGVSVADVLSAEDVRTMADDPILFPMANPVPEIMPELALEAGAAVVGTGRSDYPNQVNNVLAFPGIFRGALDAGATRITAHMKVAAAYALADAVDEPVPERILPSAQEMEAIMPRVAEAVAAAAREELDLE